MIHFSNKNLTQNRRRENIRLVCNFLEKSPHRWLEVREQFYIILTDRIGGRTVTRQLLAADGSRDFWDLGGEWVGR